MHMYVIVSPLIVTAAAHWRVVIVAVALMARIEESSAQMQSGVLGHAVLNVTVQLAAPVPAVNVPCWSVAAADRTPVPALQATVPCVVEDVMTP